MKKKSQSKNPVDDGWDRLLKIRGKLRKQSKAIESSKKSGDEVTEKLIKIGKN